MSCQKNLVSVLALEWLELPLNHMQPVICLQGVAGSGEGVWLGSQESCQLVIHGLLSGLLVDEGIGQSFQYEGLIVYRLCQVPDRWRWWQWRFSLASSPLLVYLMLSLNRVLSVLILRSSCARGCRGPTMGELLNHVRKPSVDWIESL